MVLSVTELWKLVNTVKCCIFCILILQLSKRRNFAAFQFCIFPVLYIQLLLVFTTPLMGKVNFHGYLISRFYPTHDICGNFMHTKIHVLQYLLKFGSSASRQLNISPFRSFSSHHCTIICHLIFSTHSPRRQTTLLITIHYNNNNFYKKKLIHMQALHWKNSDDTEVREITFVNNIGTTVHDNITGQQQRQLELSSRSN